MTLLAIAAGGESLAALLLFVLVIVVVLLSSDDDLPGPRVCYAAGTRRTRPAASHASVI